MRPLDIPPHSPAASRLAVASLALIAGFALVSGYLRQVVAAAPQPQVVTAGADTIAEATPAPEPTLQVAEPAPRRVHVAEPVDLSDDIPPPDNAPAAANASAADASASAPDPAPVSPSDPPSSIE
jgi:hypothetical protein